MADATADDTAVEAAEAPDDAADPIDDSDSRESLSPMWDVAAAAFPEIWEAKDVNVSEAAAVEMCDAADAAEGARRAATWLGSDSTTDAIVYGIEIGMLYETKRCAVAKVTPTRNCVICIVVRVCLIGLGTLIPSS